jgi:hypothetical protein
MKIQAAVRLPPPPSGKKAKEFGGRKDASGERSLAWQTF